MSRPLDQGVAPALGELGEAAVTNRVGQCSQECKHARDCDHRPSQLSRRRRRPQVQQRTSSRPNGTHFHDLLRLSLEPSALIVSSGIIIAVRGARQTASRTVSDAGLMTRLMRKPGCFGSISTPPDPPHPANRSDQPRSISHRPIVRKSLGHADLPAAARSGPGSCGDRCARPAARTSRFAAVSADRRTASRSATTRRSPRQAAVTFVSLAHVWGPST